MKRTFYLLISSLMALPAGLIVGIQVANVMKQYEATKENFEADVKNACREVAQTYSIWNSHTSNEEDEASYNSFYTNADSTFSVLIAQTAQPYPLLDFEPDTLLPKIRKEQFLRFQQELEQTRRKENKRLRELYVLRSIQYCADCEENEYSIAEIFPMDSLIRAKLKANGIEEEAQIGFFDVQQQQYAYLSPGSDSTALADNSFEFRISERESVQLHFPHRTTVLWKSLTGTIASSLGLILIALVCYILATKMLIRQKKLTEMKNDFINNVTHEFKTPLATIAFALANIENEKALSNPAVIKQFTHVIKEENKRLNMRVEKVLQAGAIENKGLELEQKEVDIHQIIRDLVETYSLQLSPADIFEHQLHAENSILIGDPFHLSNAVSNLLDNALKYSSTPRQICVTTQNTKHHLQIAVTDNGMGISKEAQKLIFEKFYRVPTGNLHNIKGFGLGLSYVKAIVAGHGGELDVKSRIGKGSTFKISLPTNR
jgi:signal transduction histidine kinase